MKRIFLLITLHLIALYSKGQVYQLMPQYGYQANRMVFDSTLQIPTTCGVPTLKSVQFVNKRAAIAFDSCNNRFYTYNPKTLTWSQVSGGGASTDTTSLSNRINLKIDSLKRRSDSVFAYRNGTQVFQFKDSVGTNDTSKVVIAEVHNATGTTLLKGEVVYLFGANGSVASVKRANNRQDSTSSKTFGIVRRDILSGQNGFITTQGQIDKLNLGAYVEGDVLWLDSIDGRLTKFKPIAPFHSVFIGIVERANNGNGIAYVKPQNGFEIGELHDVRITSPINNQILVYSDTQKIWKNRTLQSNASTGINGLNGTTNIGLGGTLSQNTIINGAGYQMSIGTSASPITSMVLGAENISFPSMNPRRIDQLDRITIAVIDTVNNNTLRTIPLSQVGEGKILRGKFSITFDVGTNQYVANWKILKNTTGYTWSLYRHAGGRVRLQNNVVDPNAGESFGDCTFYGGLMFEPKFYSAEIFGQFFNIDKHIAQINIYDELGNFREEVNDACFEVILYDDGTCPTGNNESPN